MPIFEYKCKDCGSLFEVLHKTVSGATEVSCPECNSLNNQKLISAFSTLNSSGSSFEGGCPGGNCSLPSYGVCNSGMCGLEN